MNRGRSILGAAALAAMAMAGLGASAQHQAGVSAIRDGAGPSKNVPNRGGYDARSLQAILGTVYGGSGIGRPKRRGWSVAEDRRRARKRRNQARNRKAHR